VLNASDAIGVWVEGKVIFITKLTTTGEFDWRTNEKLEKEELKLFQLPTIEEYVGYNA